MKEKDERKEEQRHKQTNKQTVVSVCAEPNRGGLGSLSVLDEVYVHW